MRRDKGDPAYLYDMLQAARDVVRFAAGKSKDDYDADDLLRAALERKVEIIGEAARGVSKALREATPQVAWHPIMATRHILAHEYDIVDQAAIWRAVSEHVPALIGLLEPLLPPPPPDPLPEDDPAD